MTSKHLKKNLLIIISLLFVCGFSLAEEIDKYTNKNEINIRGQADPAVNVDIFVNDKKIKTVKADSDGGWSADAVPVRKEGLNQVYALARDEEGTKSNISVKLNVMVDKTPPNIYQCTVAPRSVKPGEVLEVTVKTDKDVETVTAVMPDNTVVNLQKNDEQNWSQEWVVPKVVAGGNYSLLVMAMDNAGNVSQRNSEEITIDAQPVLLIITPQEGAIVYEEIIPVKGTAKNSNSVFIQQERAVVQGDGQFAGYAKLFKPGKNQIIVQAYDATGGLMESTLSVIRLITFKDIQEHWARREIEYLATLGYVQAYPHTNIFAPDKNISRAELAALLVRIRQYPISYSETPVFSDVKTTFWAYDYIDVASRYGLVEGYPGKVYKPQNNITRAEAVAMLVRFGNIPVSRVEQAVDLDVTEKHWAVEYIAAFKASGLTPSNWQNERFYPSRPITRAEVCAILARMAEINRSIEDLIGKKTDWNYTIDSSYYTGYEQRRDSVQPAEQRVSGNKTLSSLIIGVAAPREVLVNKDLKISAASLVKLKELTAKMPDGTVQKLIFDSRTELWETAWKVPATNQLGRTRIELTALGSDGQKYMTYTNEFEIYNDVAQRSDVVDSLKGPLPGATVPVAEQTIQFDRDKNVEFTYPEYAEGESLSGVPQSGALQSAMVVSGEILTRGRMAEILAAHCKLRQAKVVAAPARDVPLTHPSVRAIKSAIVTGIIPNLAPQQFFPEKQVTKAMAAAALRKAGLAAPKLKATEGSAVLTEAEFDSWIKKKVK